MAKKKDVLLTVAVERITELQDENEKLREKIAELERDVEFWNGKALNELEEVKKLEDRIRFLQKTFDEAVKRITEFQDENKKLEDRIRFLQKAFDEREC